ncbi:MAG: hypothetical protein H7233_00110 [Pseudorhodobacter sp.]|nr:hypothetical protein [Frankiaceae bacterium]
MRRPAKKSLVIIAALALVVGGAGAAFAYWTTSGSGTGTAQTTTPTSTIGVHQISIVKDLHPGGPVVDLAGDFNNGSDGPLFVATVTVSISGVTRAPGAVGECGAGDYTLKGDVMTVGREIPAGAGQDSWSGATIEFNNTASNQNGCKGATVNLAYIAS